MKHPRFVTGPILSAAVLAGAVVQSSPASAGLELNATYTFFSQDNITFHSPEFGVELTNNNLTIRGQWGFASADLPQLISTDPTFDEDELIWFNPYISALHTLDLKLLKLRVGLGATLPVSMPDGSTIQFANINTAMRGGYNVFIYAPDTFSLVATAEAELKLGPLELEGDFSPFGLISVASESNEADGFGFQAGAQAYYSILSYLGIGFRIQGARLPENYANEDFQLGIEPFAVVNLSPVQVRAGLWMNLTEPYGFSFDDEGIYGFNVGLAIKL